MEKLKDCLGMVVGWGLLIFAIVVVVMAVDSNNDSDNTLTQNDCLQKSLFKYQGECVDYNEIPVNQQEAIWNEVATEISETRGISKEEALMEILFILESNVE